MRGSRRLVLDFSNRRATQKGRFGGELFPAETAAEPAGTTFLTYFQRDRDTGRQLTQRVLADRLNVAEQQVQRWEATAYAGVGLERLQDIADALGTRIHENVTYSSAA